MRCLLYTSPLIEPIALALLTGTKLILADEPLSALAVTVQAQIMSLIKELKEREKIAFLFVSHDLDVVSILCEREIFLQGKKITEYQERQRINDQA